MRDYLETLRQWWIGYSVLPQDTAMGVTVAVTALLGLLVLALFMRSFQGSLPVWVPMMATLLLVLSIGAELLMQRSFYGSVDRRCHEYHNGALEFTLVGNPLLVQEHQKLFAPRLLILVVQVPERWGERVHVCGVNEQHPLAQLLLEAYEGQRDERWSPGNGVMFTFGGGGTMEGPNVTFQPDFIPPEKGSPDEPDDEV